MFKRFETLVDPYPADDAGTPPSGFWRFIWHYSRPMAPWLIIMAVLTADPVGDRAGLLLVHRHAGRLADRRRPRRLPRRARLGARRHGGHRPRRLPGGGARPGAVHVPDVVRQLPDAGALAGAPPAAAPEPRLLPGRVRRPRVAEGDADGARRARDGDEADGCRRLHRHHVRRHGLLFWRRSTCGCWRRSACGWPPMSGCSSGSFPASARSARRRPTRGRR